MRNLLKAFKESGFVKGLTLAFTEAHGKEMLDRFIELVLSKDVTTTEEHLS